MLGADVAGPDDDALGGSVVREDLGVEALREGQSERHQPDERYDDSGAAGREPGPERVDYGHVPARKTGNALRLHW